jgi:hypothetical protein
MANVLTNEKPIENVEPPTAPAIRAAILAHIPEDENIQRDIRIHDGIVDLSIKWRTIRWSECMSMADMSPDMIGLKAAESFRKWLVSTLNNVNDTPRHQRVLHDMETWLLGQNEGIWADVTRLRDGKGEFKWLIESQQMPSNVTEYEASA